LKLGFLKLELFQIRYKRYYCDFNILSNIMSKVGIASNWWARNIPRRYAFLSRKVVYFGFM